MLTPTLSTITLGVQDVARSTAFYTQLGWTRSQAASNDSISFFKLNNIVLALFEEAALANDSGMPDAPARDSFRGMTLAQNYASEAAVDSACRDAEAAGARVRIAPVKTFWGGYHAIVQDLDGHVLELAHNPFFPLRDDGTVALPP